MYRFPDSISYSTMCEHLIPFTVADYAKYVASVIPRPRMHFDEFVDWCVEHINALEVQYGSPTMLLICAVVLFISLSTVALLLVTCFWWAGGFERPGEQTDETELEQHEVIYEDDGGDTHPISRTVITGHLDNPPHEAGDDGGVHPLRKSKRE
ncbi:hypothetical protein FGIG_09973 [Fasciola gigantica]|uniref:Uncharacterized protein n=1 Tax=Fasciola gigantica TaxID=46835 RepID=A0A504YNG3_FASGI|nr:hypothetical protein FGIG_09973 [Fasciola gigantica]